MRSATPATPSKWTSRCRWHCSHRWDAACRPAPALDVRPGTSLAIFGCGCVGLSAITAARVAGVIDIIAVDVNPDRLQLASELGATATLIPDDFADANALVSNIRAMAPTGGRCPGQ
jgi:Zn-dependent alcohol dehydrogenase